ncbi:MAG: CYTH domain-containing protein, partial [Pseudomonadota bacterium]
MGQPNNHRPITQREYKMILAADRFGDRRRGADAFRELVLLIAHRHDGDATQLLATEERRNTHYLDTPVHDLRRRGYALRIREELDKDRVKTTLKHRDADRYLAGAHDLTKPK